MARACEVKQRLEREYPCPGLRVQRRARHENVGGQHSKIVSERSRAFAAVFPKTAMTGASTYELDKMGRSLEAGALVVWTRPVGAARSEGHALASTLEDLGASIVERSFLGPRFPMVFGVAQLR